MKSAEQVRSLETLAGLSRQLTAELHLDSLTEALLEAAQSLTGARYAALGVLDKTETQFAQFLTRGLDEATRQAIGTPPTRRGLLGHAIREPGSMRLADLTQHPAFTGFPPHHQPMRSFLSAPIHARGHLFGLLYLADKLGRAGTPIEFTEQDEQLIGMLAAQAGIAIENSAVHQELRSTLAQLERTNMALRVATREMEEMTSIVAHDLKAPLVTIQGYAGRLVAAFADHADEKCRRAVAVIRDVSKHMGAMLDGLLEVSRLHRRTLRPQPCRIAEIVERVRTDLGEAIGAVGASIALELDPRATSVRVDPVAFHEVLQNLLSNALKFGAPGQPLAIQIGTTAQEASVLLWVRDNGIGIPADKLEAVFQIFRKLDRNSPGVGIGLAAVKKLVQQSGGAVWTESELGRGTTVFVKLPQE